MGRIQAWAESRHRQNPGIGRIQAWAESRPGQNPGMGRVQAWAETRHGPRPEELCIAAEKQANPSVFEVVLQALLGW